MASKNRQDRVKVLLAQFPLETHSRGLLTVAGMLRDAGMEVVLMGNALPEQIINAAVQEYVDVVGISTYCGGELARAVPRSSRQKNPPLTQAQAWSGLSLSQASRLQVLLRELPDRNVRAAG